MSSPTTVGLTGRKRKAVNYAELADPGIDESDYVQPSAPKKPKLIIQGRSGSAPPVSLQGASSSLCYQSRPLPSFHTYVPDISKFSGWDAADTKKGIRLAYVSMDPAKKGELQGLFIDDPAVRGSACTELPKHFDKIREEMETPTKVTTATEATGEAAAALYMCKTHQGADMMWGAHLHSGPGIDQIWHTKSTDPQKYPDGAYMVVEAKGVGAQLSDKNDVDIPIEIQRQMSPGWVGHNLAKMKRNRYKSASTLMSAVGLQEETKNGKAFYESFNKRPTSYYKCKHDPTTQTAEMLGVVVEAEWTPNGQLSYKVVERHKYF